MNEIEEIKNTLLIMLESVFRADDNITANQQLGVNLSNSVKRDGVVIIQNQNVEVCSRIVPSLVHALRLCDSIKSNALMVTPPVPIEQKSFPLLNDIGDEKDPDPIDECCAWMYENSIGWEDMQDLMKVRYVEYVMSKSKTGTEAAKMLGIGATYLSRIRRLVSENKSKENKKENGHEKEKSVNV